MRFFILCLCLLAASEPCGLTQTPTRPLLLYSRHFNAQGEDRYLPNGTYSDVLEKLRKEFDVVVHDRPLTPETLQKVTVLLLVNLSDHRVATNPPPNKISQRDIKTVTDFVAAGGGLIFLGNQPENHNLEIEHSNQLLARFGIQMTNKITGVKRLVIPKGNDLIGGLAWGYYTGNLLMLDSSHAAKPRPLVSNDSSPTLNNTASHDGVLMARAELGKGRVVAATDAGWIANFALREEGIGGVAVKGQENWEIFKKISLWCAGK